MSSKVDNVAKVFAFGAVGILSIGLIYVVLTVGIWALNVLGFPVSDTTESYIALFVLFLLFGRN